MRQLLFGSTVKSTVNPWDLDSSVGWTSIGGNATMQGIELYFRHVPWFRRGVKDRALNVSALPWAILTGDEEIVTNADWSDNKPADLEWLDNPRKLFGQVEQSLAITGRAYIFLECNQFGYIKAAKYCAPNTITEVYDPVTGRLAYFERAVNTMRIKCDPAGAEFQAGVGRIVAIYDADYLTEEGHPATSSDGLAALSAAGVLYSTDRFVEQFFSRGAIKASILSVEGGAQSEIDRLQAWWDDVISGVKNAWAALVMRGKMAQPVVIGQGTEGLENDSLSTAKRQDIATALGVPESRMWSSAANYATRNADEKAYFRGTIIPEFDLIAEAFNAQVFTAAHNLDGWRLESQPETLDVFQDDEADRASSLQALVNSGVPLKLGMQILGYDLTEEQWAELEEQGPEPEPMPVQPAPALPEPEPLAQPEEMLALTEGMTKELEIWQRKAIKAWLEIKHADCDFTCSHLSPVMADDIHAALEGASNVDEIKAVFAGVRGAKYDPWLDAANRLTAALERLG